MMCLFATLSNSTAAPLSATHQMYPLVTPVPLRVTHLHHELLRSHTPLDARCFLPVSLHRFLYNAAPQSLTSAPSPPTHGTNQFLPMSSRSRPAVECILAQSSQVLSCDSDVHTSGSATRSNIPVQSASQSSAPPPKSAQHAPSALAHTPQTFPLQTRSPSSSPHALASHSPQH